MFIFGEIFVGLAQIVRIATTLYIWLIIGRVIVSWVGGDPYNPIVQFLMQATEPVLAFFRRLPLQVGMLDLSPIVAIISISVVSNILVRILIGFAAQLDGGGAGGVY